MDGRALGRLLVALLAATAAGCGGEEGRTWHGLALSPAPSDGAGRRGGAILLAAAPVDDYATFFGQYVAVVRRSALAPGEVLPLYLIGRDGTDLTDRATWTSSAPDVVAVEAASGGGSAYLKGVAEGGATVCAKAAGDETCTQFAVGAFFGQLVRRSDDFSQRDETNAILAADGYPVASGPVYGAGSTWNKPPVASADGAWALDPGTRALVDVRRGRTIELPAIPQEGDGPTMTALATTPDGVVVTSFTDPFRPRWSRWNGDDWDRAMAALPLPGGTQVATNLVPLTGGRWVLLPVYEAAIAGDVIGARIEVLDLQDGSLEKLADGVLDNVIDVAWSPDGRTVAVGASDGESPPARGRLLLLDVSDGGVRLLRDEPWPAVRPVFVQDGARLVSEACREGVLDVDVETWTIAHHPAGGRLTPWGTIHYAAGAEVFEIRPGSQEALPSRVFGTGWRSDPSGGFLGLASTSVPVSAYQGTSTRVVSPLAWLSSGRTAAPVEPPAPADAPASFVAFLQTIESCPIEGQDQPATVLEVLPTEGGRSRLLVPGSQDVAAFDVAADGTIFLVTSPAGYLVVSDTRMQRTTVLATGARPPLAVSPDARLVAFQGPGEASASGFPMRVLDVATGAEVARVAAQSLCLSGVDASGAPGPMAWMSASRLVRRDASGNVTDAAADTTGASAGIVSWSDDCGTVLVVSDRTARLHDGTRAGFEVVGTGSEPPVRGGDVGEVIVDTGTVSRDGTRVVLGRRVGVSIPIEGVDVPREYLDSYTLLDLVEVVRPGDTLRRIWSHEGREGGYASAVLWSFLEPALDRTGARLAVPFGTDLVDQRTTDIGVVLDIRSTLELLLFDLDGGGATSLGAMPLAEDDARNGARRPVRFR